MKRLLFAATLALASLTLVACNEERPASPPTQREQQAAVARRAAEAIQMVDNAEIENIQRRLRLTANPGAIGYIVLLNEAGQPILYESVRGKVTTSGSRLTPPDTVRTLSSHQGGISQVTVRAPSDTGTYDTGTASFIYYWNMAGAYRQWSGPYLYSDRPTRLRIEPLVINTTTDTQ